MIDTNVGIRSRVQGEHTESDDQQKKVDPSGDTFDVFGLHIICLAVEEVHGGDIVTQSLCQSDGHIYDA